MPNHPHVFRDRPPSPEEFERLRLILSTFRDGSGQERPKGLGPQPGWRDFERAVAWALGGATQENKGVFDVLVTPPCVALPYGLSCKTSAVANLAPSKVLFELHNSNAKAWDELMARGVAQGPGDDLIDPYDTGLALIEQVGAWHDECRPLVDVSSSSYLVLIHDRRTWGHWRLLWYPLTLDKPDPASLTWSREGRRIQGADPSTGERLWEWYGWSGGQLKYYPRVSDATWDSGWFSLETPRPEDLTAKAATYFASQWPSSLPAAGGGALAQLGAGSRQAVITAGAAAPPYRTT